MIEPSDPSDDEEQFNQAIQRTGVKDECPRCDSASWKVLEGDYAFIKVSTDPTNVGTAGIPCAVAICTACGFVAMHAIGALDM